MFQERAAPFGLPPKHVPAADDDELIAAKVFRVWDTAQAALFPPSFRELVPEKHLVHFVRRVVSEQLDRRAGS